MTKIDQVETGPYSARENDWQSRAESSV